MELKYEFIHNSNNYNNKVYGKIKEHSEYLIEKIWLLDQWIFTSKDVLYKFPNCATSVLNTLFDKNEIYLKLINKLYLISYEKGKFNFKVEIIYPEVFKQHGIWQANEIIKKTYILINGIYRINSKTNVNLISFYSDNKTIYGIDNNTGKFYDLKGNLFERTFNKFYKNNSLNINNELQNLFIHSDNLFPTLIFEVLNRYQYIKIQNEEYMIKECKNKYIRNLFNKFELDDYDDFNNYMEKQKNEIEELLEDLSEDEFEVLLENLFED